MQHIASYTATDDPKKFVALDFETVGTDPWASNSQVRLAQFVNDEAGFIIDFGVGAANFFYETAHLLLGGKYVVFNIGFERRWFYRASEVSGKNCNVALYDLALLRKAIQGGGHQRLSDIALEDLGIQMDKSQGLQVHGWDALELRPEKYEYAYADSVITWDLWKMWLQACDPQRWAGFKLFNDMSPAVIEMEETGMLLDAEVHKKLIENWIAVKESLAHSIYEMTNHQIGNIGSSQQWSKYLTRTLPVAIRQDWTKTGKTGNLSMAKEHLEDIAYSRPPEDKWGMLFRALLGYKKVSTYLTMFGDKLLFAGNPETTGRVYGRFNIAFTITGRFTGSNPNLQQTPRDAEMLGKMQSVRSSFIAPEGYQLISLDYSGIEIRVLALLSGDGKLLESAIHGDLHSEIASAVAGREIDKNDPTDKMLRSKAKEGTFMVLYGGGARTVGHAMETSEAEGAAFIDTWANRFPVAFKYRDKIMEEVSANGGYLRCHGGGTIYMGENLYMPKCANYPVQRGALVVMARALTRFKDNLNVKRGAGKLTSARMLATIHDQIIAEAQTKEAEGVLEVMRTAMLDGFADVFPEESLENLVEGGIGNSWGDI